MLTDCSLHHRLTGGGNMYMLANDPCEDTCNGARSGVRVICGDEITAGCSFGAWHYDGDGTHSRTCQVCGHRKTADCTFDAWHSSGNGLHSRTCSACRHQETESRFYAWVDNENGAHSYPRIPGNFKAGEISDAAVKTWFAAMASSPR